VASADDSHSVSWAATNAVLVTSTTTAKAVVVTGGDYAASIRFQTVC